MHTTPGKTIRRSLALPALLLVSLVTSTNLAAEEEKAEKITYEDDVLPIFRQKCFNCHNTDKKTAGLDLTSYASMIEGGGSGTAVEPGDASSSYLYMLVSHESEPYMPPNSEKLPGEMLAVLEKWINNGALENKSSKARPKKANANLTVASPSAGRPEGPPPMPLRLDLDPVIRTTRTAGVRAMATSPWAPLVAIAGQQQVLLYNTQTLELAGVLPFPEGEAHVLKFSRNGSLLLAGGGRGSYQGRVIVFDVKTGNRVIEVGDELDAVLAADISADQSLIALGGPQRIVRVYSTATGELEYDIRKHTEWIYGVEFSPDGVLLATSDRNGGMHVWEAYTGREYLRLGGHGAAAVSLSWRSDSNILASCSEDNNIKLWEMNNGSQVKNWGAHGGGAQCVEFTRDGNLVSTGRDRLAKLWDQNGKQIRAFEAFGDIALQVTHCDETARVIAGDWTGAIRVWNAADGALVGELTSNPPKLEERLAAATQALNTQQAEHEKLQAAYKAAEAELNKQKGELESAVKAAAETKQQAEAANQAATAAKQTLDKLTAERDAAAKTVATLDPVVPLLKEASEKGLQAAGKSPEDKELAAAAAQFKAKFDAKSAELATAKTTVDEKSKALEPSQQELAKAQKLAADTAAAAQAAAKRVEDLTPLVKAAEEKTAQAKQALDGAAQSLAAAQAEVTRWQGEIEFHGKLVALSERVSEHAELAAVFDDAQGELEQMQAALEESNRAAAAAQKTVEAATGALNQAKGALGKATAEHEAAVKDVSIRESVIPPLKATLVQAQDAAAKSAGDKEVEDAATAVKALLDKKNVELEAAKKGVPDKAAAIETSKQQVAEAEKQVTATTEALQAAQKKVAEATAAVAPAQQKATAAKQAADAAMQTVQAAQQEVDRLRGIPDESAQASANAGG